MYKIPLEDIKNKVVSSGKISAEEFDSKVKEKINELSGLVSEEGAAHIIANELSVELVDPDKDKLKIKEIYSGMKKVSTVGKVTRKYELRTFQKGDSLGKVCSMNIADETGTIRLVFWNDQADKTERINENDILEIKDAYVRENNGNKEIHMGDRADLTINPEGVTIDNVRETASFSFTRKKINEFQGAEENIEILGTVVQVFDPRFFTVCPQCNKRVNDNQCQTHGEVQPSLSYVLNAVLDDGTGTIRAVFWKEQTNHLTSKTNEEMGSYKEELSKFEDVKNDLLGEQFKLSGKVSTNEMFGRLELSVRLVEKAKPEEEIARLQE